MKIQSLALAVVLASASILGAAGCMEKSNEHHTMSPPNTMNNDAMIKKGDDMIAEGKKMKDTSAMMAEGEMKMGMSKSEMDKKGQKMIDDGQAMKTKAMSQQM